MNKLVYELHFVNYFVDVLIFHINLLKNNDCQTNGYASVDYGYYTWQYYFENDFQHVGTVMPQMRIQ